MATEGCGPLAQANVAAGIQDGGMLGTVQTPVLRRRRVFVRGSHAALRDERWRGAARIDRRLCVGRRRMMERAMSRVTLILTTLPDGLDLPGLEQLGIGASPCSVLSVDPQLARQHRPALQIALGRGAV
jgi:hypothetical protein